MACGNCNSYNGSCKGTCNSGNSCSSCDSGACDNKCNYCNACNTGCDTNCNDRCYNCQVCVSTCNMDQTCKSCNICNSSCHNWYTTHYENQDCQGYDSGEEKLICYDNLPKNWAQCHNQDPCPGVHGCGTLAYGRIDSGETFDINKYFCDNS